MTKQNFLDDIAARLAEIMATSPARDVEKNVKAAASGLLGKLDLVTREEFDVQTQVLAQLREKLTVLEARLAELEGTPGTSTTDQDAP